MDDTVCGATCGHCKVVLSKQMRCRKCNIAVYCSKECQKGGHKMECKRLNAQIVMEILRTAMMVKKLRELNIASNYQWVVDFKIEANEVAAASQTADPTNSACIYYLLAQGINHLGINSQSLRTKEGLALLEKSIVLLKEHDHLCDDDKRFDRIELWSVYGNLAASYHQWHHYEKAEKMFKRSLAIGMELDPHYAGLMHQDMTSYGW